MTYDYEKAVKDDVRKAILDNDYGDEIARCGNMDEVVHRLENLMNIDDYVTGNGSGTYTGNREKTRSYLAGNEYLIVKALEAIFGDDADAYKDAIMDPDFADVNIRCHLLFGAICEVVDEPQIKRYVQGIIGTKKVQSKNVKPKKTVRKPVRKPTVKKRPIKKAVRR